LLEARKIVRQACHILTELGGDALTAAEHPSPMPLVTSPRRASPGHARRSRTHPMGTTAAGSREPLSAAADPAAKAGQAGGLIRLSGRIPPIQVRRLRAGMCTRVAVTFGELNLGH
jgi:hypothetical protein